MSVGFWSAVGVGCVIAGLQGIRYWAESRKLQKAFKKEGPVCVLFHGDFGSCTESICGTISSDYAACGFQNLRKLLQYIESAKSTVDVCLYHISNIELYRALASCWDRGIRVRVITDISSKESPTVKDLMILGIPIKITQSKEHIMHHKVIIIDGRSMLCGSFNWTLTSLYNAESVALITDPDMLQTFRSEFNRLWKQMP